MPKPILTHPMELMLTNHFRGKRSIEVSVLGDGRVVDVEFVFRPLFRNYKPIDDILNEVVLPDAPVGNVIEEIKDQLDAANSKVRGSMFGAFLSLSCTMLI